jgi:biopolymer transport protein ExbB/TolQ
MSLSLCVALSSAPQNPPPLQLRSFTETLLNGGPVMIPLGICSVLVLAWVIERAVRMRGAALGNALQAQRLVAAARDRGPSGALELARSQPNVLSSIFRPVFERWHESRPNLRRRWRTPARASCVRW